MATYGSSSLRSMFAWILKTSFAHMVEVKATEEGVGGMAGIPSVENARSTQSSNSSAEKNFEIFLAYQNGQDSSWPVLIRDISEAQANDVKLYERYSSWLTFNFESNRGAPQRSAQ